MSTEKSLAIVLKVVDFSETSRVTTLFTREHGKISGLAKGARRLRGPFDAALDLLTLCRIVFIRKSSASLDLLTEASVVKRFRPKGNQLCRYYAAFYVAELIAGLTEPYAALPRLFDEAQSTLALLERSDAVATVVARFELVTLRELGYMPQLERCASCGRNLELTGKVLFSAAAGGALCSDCRKGQSGVFTVSAGTMRALNWLASAKGTPVQRLRVGRQTFAELRGLLQRYITFQAGREFRLHRYLN